MAEKQRWWKQLFPGFAPIAEQNLNGLSLPPGAGIYEQFAQDAAELGGVSESAEDGEMALTELPKSRIAQYAVYRTMGTDSSIDSALKIHISHALSAKEDTGEIVTIESTGKAEDPIVKNLRDSMQPIFNRYCQFWGYQAALNGSCFARIYGEDGKGVQQVRSDYYTRPEFTSIYEQAGNVCGYVSSYQQPQKGGLNLIEPWKMVAFRVPIWETQLLEPVRVDASKIFDLAEDDFRNDSIVESQNYGTSLLKPAYQPWMDLQNAIVSLNMSRKNASRQERLIGVNTGKLNPQTAANYLNLVAQQIKNVDRANAQRSLKRGFVQTVVNHLIPIFGDGRARLDISTVEGVPNITDIADVMFHVNRLGGAMGVDPSLLGFGELLSGGLGDGGFLRVSILASIKAKMLRTAILEGMQHICRVHIAYKYKKVFLPGEEPWRIVFNSVSSAMEREEMENREGRVQLATGIAQLIGLVDQEWASVDRNIFFNTTFTDILKFDEEKVKLIFPKDKAKEAEELAKKKLEEGGGFGGKSSEDGITESAADLKSLIDSIY